MVQGYGKVGAPLVDLLTALGMRVVAVADVHGAVHNAAGIDPAALSSHGAVHGTVAGFPAGEPLERDQVFDVACDLLVPAALGGAITAEVAERLQARIVVEAANGPVTPGGDGALAERGIVVVPDVLANAGGVVASYFRVGPEPPGLPVGS